MGMSAMGRQAISALYVPGPMRREVQIVNELGLHARPAAEFVRCAMSFESEIRIHKDGKAFSATSIMEVLTANLNCDECFELEAIGPDEAKALDRLAELLGEFRGRDREGGDDA
jgi:phosphocarrier protein HPr